MSRRALPWLLGLFLPVAVLGGYLVIRGQRANAEPSKLSEHAQVAKAASARGLDGDAAARGLDLLKKIEKTNDLSDSEWKEVKAMADHPQSIIATGALAIMGHLKDAPRREESLQIARVKRKSTDGHMRRSALILLYHLRAPEWRSEVEAAKASTDPDERQVAEALLRRDAGLPPSKMR